MTLFKKVFDSHFTEDVPEIATKPPEVSEIECPTTSSSSAVETMSEKPFAARAEVVPREDVVTAMPHLDRAPVAPENEEEMSRAQRAALMHAQIIATRQPAQPALDATVDDRLDDLRSELTRPQSIGSEPTTLQSEAARRQMPDTAPTAPTNRSGGRVKTRLLGFHQTPDLKADPFSKLSDDDETPPGLFPTGWLVVVDGPGEGNALAVYDGVSTIGRGNDQVLSLDFGDTSISRQNHAAIAYDAEQSAFFLGHGGKSNIIRLNDRPVLSTEELNHADILRIGETTLRFVALCGAEFKWNEPQHAE